MNQIFVVQERSLFDRAHSTEGFKSYDKADTLFREIVTDYGVEPNDAMFDEDGNGFFQTEDNCIVELFSMAVVDKL